MLINGTRGKKVFRIYEQTKSMKNSQKELIKFDLLENAKDSLFHAVEHLTNEGKEPNAGDYKRVILDVSHSVELLLKERVQEIHPAFLWKRVEEFGDPDAQTIGVEQAVTRLLKIGNIVLSEKALKTIRRCKRIRNSIEHHAFEIESKEARAVIGRILSFIFTFSNKHLGLDLESDFRRDDRWKSLIEIYEFFEEHSKALEEELCNKGAWVINCPQCGAQTFNVSLTRCEMCDHYEELVECESCKESCFESETESYEDGDENGVYSYTICRDCLKSEAEEAHALDMMADSYRQD